MMIQKFFFGMVVICIVILFAAAISASKPDPFPDGATYRTGGAGVAICESPSQFFAMMAGLESIEVDTGDPNSRFWYLNEDNNTLMQYETRANGQTCMVGLAVQIDGEIEAVRFK